MTIIEQYDMIWKVYFSIQERKGDMKHFTLEQIQKYITDVPPEKHQEFVDLVILRVTEVLISKLEK